LNTKVLSVGVFRRHGYAHHWQGIRLGFDAIEGVDLVEQDYRLSVEADSTTNRANKPDDLAAREIRDIRPDVVLFCIQDAITDNMLAAAKDVGAFTAFWYCDIREPKPRDLSGRLDFLAMTNAGYREKYANAWNLGADRIVWLPQACLPRAEIADRDPDLGTDILFIGSWSHPDYHESRRRVLDGITNRFGTTFVTDRDQYNQGPRPTRATFYNMQSDQEKESLTRNLPALYASTRIAVGVSVPIAGYHSNRLFLATGHGACYVCNDFPGIEQLFDPTVEIMTFATKTLADGVAACLGQDPKTLRQIARAGFVRAQADHTYPVRIRELWECIQRRR